MRKIPCKLRDKLSDDSYYQKCARRYDGGCSGRITWEHSFIYAGRQINERWAIIPLCWYHHLGEGLDKEINVWIALGRATNEELQSISKAEDYIHKRYYLNKKYGQYSKQGKLL